MAQEIKERILAECIGIRCFNEIDGNEKYDLIPINEWTKEICDELNKTDFSKKYVLNESCSSVLQESSINIDNKFQNLKKIENGKFKINKIRKYEKLPNGIDYVRFNNMVILRNEEIVDNVYAELESSIIENLGIVSSFDTIKSKLLKECEPINAQNVEKYKENLENLRKICAISAHFSTNKRPQNGSDNHIWYELLQNANDHIPSHSESKELKISFDEDNNTFTLEYPDEGFSVRDFLAICTEGNSGNVLSDENREGRKGTGFKSVYNLFNQVTISSGPVKCVLKDVEKNISISKEGKINVTNKDEERKSEYYYPIPEFDYLETPKDGKTIISFQSKEVESIKKLVFGSEGINENSSLEDLVKMFEKKEDYLFLDNICKFSFTYKKNNSEKAVECFDFNRESYIQKNYYIKDYDINDDGIKQTNNPNWKNRSDELFNKKKKLTFLFLKNIEFTENVNEHRVYCTLPIEEFKLKVLFYVNIPLLELKDDRKSLADQTMQDFNFKEWNQKVLEFGLIPGFKSIVETDIKKIESNSFQANDDSTCVIELANWYKYFPYEYLVQNNKVFEVDWAENLKKVKFLRTTTSTKVGGKNVKSAAICDLVQSENDLQIESKSIFLPCNMYSWIHYNIGDVFESKESGDSNEIPPVSFVYYEYENIENIGDENAKDIIEEKIEEIIKTKTRIDFKSSIVYLREQDRDAGKILLELKNYLHNDYKKKLTIENAKSAFYPWLRDLLKSNDFRFIFQKTFIYQAYFNANNVDYNGGKFHWLKKDDNSFYEEDIAEYKSINGQVNSLKTDLYGGTDYNFQQDEWNSIIFCFNDLVISPYVKYDYEWKNDQWDIFGKLRENGDSVLPQQNSEFKDDSIKQVYCYYTKELLNQSVKDPNLAIGKVNSPKDWFKTNEVVFFVKNTKGNIILASENVYFTDKDIENDAVVKYGNDFFISLEEALSEDGDFFEKNKDNDEFVEQVLKEYEFSVWKEQAISFIENSDAKIRFIIFRHIIKKSKEPIDWKNKYSGLINNFSITELWKDGKIVFVFDENKINSLSQYVLDVFENKVSSQEKDKTKKIGDKDKTLQEIVKNDIFVLPCKTGNKSLFCKGQIKESNTQREIYVLFGENAIGTLLRKVFDCYDFSENKIYDEMLCYDVDELNESEIQEVSEFADDIKSKVDELIEKWMCREQEDIKRALVTRFDVRNKGKKWFHARGYGKKDYSERKCPICKGILLSEMNALVVRNITCKISGNKYSFPMLMCKNCSETLNYAKTVELQISQVNELDESIFKVSNNSFEKYNIVFSMNGREEKSFECEISFLNRYMWKRIKEKDR